MLLLKDAQIHVRGKSLFKMLFLPAFFMMALLIPAYAADAGSFSNEIWHNGSYSTTLGDMAGRRLYVYGIVDSFSEIPVDGTDRDVNLNSDEVAGRLDAALYLYRLCGTDPQGKSPFSDVPEEYTDAVDWLYEAGVTKGISNELYGTGSITEHQLLVMLSRLLHWETEERDAVFQLADSLELLSGEANDGVFSNGELYHILSKVLDRFFPEKAVPVRAEMSIPDSLSLTANSYENAARQIRAALQFLPATISVQFTENCPQEDIDAFRSHFDWLYGNRELPIIGALDFSFVTPCFLTSYSDGRFTLWISHYADAYQGRADTLDWLRVYEDTDYSRALIAFESQYLLPLKNGSSDYDRIVKAHDLLCTLASYDYTEYFNRNRPQAHGLLGFFENGTVVCDGYAKTFQWMLNYLGIDSYELIGKANGEIHAWNKVLLDGVWYNVDVCWDDSAYYRTFLLKSDSHFENHLHSFTDGFSKTVFASTTNYKSQ